MKTKHIFSILFTLVLSACAGGTSGTGARLGSGAGGKSSSISDDNMGTPNISIHRPLSNDQSETCREGKNCAKAR